MIIQFKQGMFDNEIISDLSLENLVKSRYKWFDTEYNTYFLVNEEVTILTDESGVLRGKVLMLKANEQSVHQDCKENIKKTEISLKLYHLHDENKLLVEAVNINDIIPRENQTSSRIQLYARLFPDASGSYEVIERSQIVHDVGKSIIFDLQDKPVRFKFDIDHLINKNDKINNAFVSINLFHLNKAHLKLSAGEAVIQVSSLNYITN